MEESWDNLTGTARVKLPKRPFRGGQRLDKLLSRGDKCKVQLGYNDRLNTVFTGYVDRLGLNTPVEVFLEDEMFQLKQREVKPKSWSTADLKTVLSYIGVTNYKPLGEITWQGGFQIKPETDTAAKVLALLKQQLNMMIYFKDKTLYVGRPYDPAAAKRVKFAFGYNIIKANLEFKRAEDVKLQVEVIINLANGKKKHLHIGDKGGEKRTLNYYDVSEAAAKQSAQRLLTSMKYTGLYGDFTAFGEPLVRMGDIVELFDEVDGDKTGAYWVKAVSRTSGMSGIRQVIKLAEKV